MHPSWTILTTLAAIEAVGFHVKSTSMSTDQQSLTLGTKDWESQTKRTTAVKRFKFFVSLDGSFEEMDGISSSSAD